jgi:hypothetical protein
MENASRTIAKMWKRDGCECFVHKRGDRWFLTVERSGVVLEECEVDSPGEAIRRSKELLHSRGAAD